MIAYIRMGIVTSYIVFIRVSGYGLARLVFWNLSLCILKQASKKDIEIEMETAMSTESDKAIYELLEALSGYTGWR